MGIGSAGAALCAAGIIAQIISTTTPQPHAHSQRLLVRALHSALSLPQHGNDAQSDEDTELDEKPPSNGSGPAFISLR